MTSNLNGMRGWGLLLLSSVFLTACANGDKRPKSEATWAPGNATVIATRQADIDEFDAQLLRAAGGGKLEDHWITLHPSQVRPESGVFSRKYWFAKESNQSSFPFVDAWHQTNEHFSSERNVVLTFERDSQPPACALSCSSGCSCTNCVQVTNLCGPGAKCLKNNMPLSCNNRCCP